MALTKAEIKQYVLDIVNDDRGWNWTQWDDECHRLSVHIKFDQQLIDLEALYENKLRRLYEHYQEMYDTLKYGVSESFITTTPEEAIADLKQMKDKLRRIALKWNTVKAEIRGRELGFFDRTPIGTTYYIDLDSGNDSNDGLSTGNAWLTLEKYTTVTVRSAGDIAYVRANTDQAKTDGHVGIDEDGDEDNFIKIIGCDSTVNDPWGDGSDVKPILTFSDNAYRLVGWDDDFWYIERLAIKDSSYTSGNIQMQNSNWWHLKSCDITGNSGSGETIGHLISASYFVLIEGCTYQDNSSRSTKVSSGSNRIKFKGCAWNGGSTHQSSHGLYAHGKGTRVECEDCDFGQTTSHSNKDYYSEGGADISLRNCREDVGSGIWTAHAVFWKEDKDGTYGSGEIEEKHGTTTKQSSPKTGDADFSLKMTPTADTGVNRPLTLHNDLLLESPFVIEGTASTEVTITIKMQAESAWATYPTASELYIEASYYDSGSDAGRSTIASTQTISSASTWVDFTVTMTPQRNGPIYVNVYLKKYESGKSITVNGEATTS